MKLMNRQQHINLILDYFQHPRYQGALTEATITYTSSNPGCGDVVTVYLHSTDLAAPVTMSFEGQGCTISQAAASMMVEMLQGKTLAEIEDASIEPLLALVGPEIASARRRCVTLSFDAIKHAASEQAAIHRTEFLS